MKCEVCLPLLEEYFDSALVEREAAQVSGHLITCASCANEFDALSAEQEIYSRYDRALAVSPLLWNRVEAVIARGDGVIASNPPFSLRNWLGGLFATPSFGVSFAGAVAVLIVAAVIGVAYWRTHRQPPKPQETVKIDHNEPTRAPGGENTGKGLATKSKDSVAVNPNHGPAKSVLSGSPKSALAPASKQGASNQSDVLFSDVAYSDVEDQDTQRHIEQAQNLLRSVRNLEVADGADDIDVSYEKALSRRLLNENVVLRRDAEMSGKFPVKTLLSSLEPFLIDIANLPERTSADDLRVIKERVQKTEIVAALHTF